MKLESVNPDPLGENGRSLQFSHRCRKLGKVRNQLEVKCPEESQWWVLQYSEYFCNIRSTGAGISCVIRCEFEFNFRGL